MSKRRAIYNFFASFFTREEEVSEYVLLSDDILTNINSTKMIQINKLTKTIFNHLDLNITIPENLNKLIGMIERLNTTIHSAMTNKNEINVSPIINKTLDKVDVEYNYELSTKEQLFAKIIFLLVSYKKNNEISAETAKEILVLFLSLSEKYFA